MTTEARRNSPMMLNLTPAEQALSDTIHTEGGGTVLYDAEIRQGVAAVSPFIAADALDTAAAVWRACAGDEPSGLDESPEARLQRRAAAIRAGAADGIQSEVDRLREETEARAAKLAAVLDLPDRHLTEVDEPGDWATGFYTGYNAGLAAAKAAIESARGTDDRP